MLTFQCLGLSQALVDHDVCPAWCIPPWVLNGTLYVAVGLGDGCGRVDAQRTWPPSSGEQSTLHFVASTNLHIPYWRSPRGQRKEAIGNELWDCWRFCSGDEMSVYQWRARTCRVTPLLSSRPTGCSGCFLCGAGLGRDLEMGWGLLFPGPCHFVLWAAPGF